MRRFSKKWSFRKKLGIRLIAFSMIIIGMLFLADVRIRPIIEQTASYQSRITATRIINDSVFEGINDEYFDYANLVKIVYSEENSVVSVESNMININRLKAKITENINSALSNIDESELSISLGTISGVHLLYGRGPTIPVHISPNGYVDTKLVSSFKSAGVNQTLHRILLYVDVNISAIIPGYTTSAEVTSEFVIAETVIVGNVPESYTHVITGSSDLVGNINDYNAENYSEEKNE